MPQTTMETLQEAWESAMPRLSAEEQRAGITLLGELAAGEPVRAAQLADALGRSVSDTLALLRESALKPFVQAMYEDGESQVKGFFGLSTSPTAHRFVIDERATLWTWCAQDSLFLPELLGETAHVESKDPETGDCVRLTVSPEGVEAVEPEGVALSMVKADTADLTSSARVIATACHFIFFFASRASAEQWVAQHPQTGVLSLEEAVAFARRQNEKMFGEELARRAAAT